MPPGIAELTPAAPADEQLDAVLVLKRTDLGGERRLADVERRGRGIEATGTGNGMERAKPRVTHRKKLSIGTEKSICFWVRPL
ncbi:hypothetical protein [Bosea sp. WAO]|uniref:hypothetical protein n=1 Tax=Bosea sp. WAO TaxID=406341 RepID=UPI0017DF49B1|nr:hypothetical protein [Bosea sp. WAO]